MNQGGQDVNRALRKFARIGVLAVVAGLALAGCGSSGSDTKSSGTAAKPQRNFANDDYHFVHTHLQSVRNQMCFSQGHGADWASTEQGFCHGRFRGGTPPWTGNEEGVNMWIKNGDQGYKIIQAVNVGEPENPKPGKAIECFIRSRNSDACYTDYQSQKDKPTGQEGGPLSLNAHFGDNRLDTYILLRGFCKNSDPSCNP